MVWDAISIDERTELHVIWNGTFIAQNYAHEIFRSPVVLHAVANGDFVFSLHDNARPHTVRLVENMLEVETK